MPDLKRSLDRGLAGFELSPDALGRTLRRIDRRRMARRIRAGALAVVVLAAMLGSALAIFRSHEGNVPSERGAYGAAAVGWTTKPGESWSSPTVADGVVYASDGGEVGAFPVDCATGGQACEPSWVSTHIGANPAPMVARDGSLFVVAGPSHERAVFAFPADCASPCEPIWTGRIGQTTRYETLIVANGYVYVEYAAQQGGLESLTAFAEDCGTAAESCSPAWSSASYIFDFSDPAGDGMVYLLDTSLVTKDQNQYPELLAFSSSCAPGGPGCDPIWTWTPTNRDIRNLVLDGDVVWASDGSSTYALPSRCSGSCAPTAMLPGELLDVADGFVYTDAGRGVPAEAEGVTRFPASCATAGTGCTPNWASKGGDQRFLTGSAWGEGYAATGNQQGEVTIYPGACDGTSCHADPIDTGIGDWIEGLAIADGVVYASSPHAGDLLLAYPADCGWTCDPLWTYSTGHVDRTSGGDVSLVGWGGFAVDGDHLFAVRLEREGDSSSQTLYAFDISGS